jgi:hypothetical protein
MFKRENQPQVEKAALSGQIRKNLSLEDVGRDKIYYTNIMKIKEICNKHFKRTKSLV